MNEWTAQELRERVDAFRTDFARVREEIGKVVVGQREIVDGVLTCLFTNGHVLLEGVPGVGKTLLVRTLAQALSLGFGRVQFTPDLMPADVTGTQVVDEVEERGVRQRRFRFQPGPIFAQILLADEINRATPKTQSALLEGMQERRVTVAGVSHELPAPFLVLATQNPIEQEGTYPLPEAQLDRFFFKLLVRAPGRDDLSAIVERTTGRGEERASPVLDQGKILAGQELVRGVALAPSVRDYAVRLVLATHPRATRSDAGATSSAPMVEQYVRLGASPRAAQALVLAGKCRALQDGRAAVAIEDVQGAALPALRHRIIMNFESHAEGVSPDAVIENLLATLPREGA